MSDAIGPKHVNLVAVYTTYKRAPRHENVGFRLGEFEMGRAVHARAEFGRLVIIDDNLYGIVKGIVGFGRDKAYLAIELNGRENCTANSDLVAHLQIDNLRFARRYLQLQLRQVHDFEKLSTRR